MSMNSVTPSVRCDVLSRLEQRYGIDLYRATGKKTMPWHMARTLDRSAHGSIAAHTVDTPQANLCASAEFLFCRNCSPRYSAGTTPKTTVITAATAAGFFRETSIASRQAERPINSADVVPPARSSSDPLRQRV